MTGLYSDETITAPQAQNIQPSRKLTRKDWRQIIQDWEESELSQSAFCSSRAINFHQFSYYRNKFLNEDRDEQALIPVRISSASETQPSNNAFILHLKGDARLIIPSSYHEQALKKLLTLLGVTA